MNSRDYWAQREAEQLKHNITDEAEYDREIKRIYQNMLDACQKEIDSFYAKYANAEGITIAEAKKRVSQHDVKAFERKAAKYVKDKDFSKKANEELRLYNATMKINRLEMLKANIGLETIAGHDELEKFMAGILKGRTEDELKRQAGILGKTVRNNAAKADAIVNGSFHSGTFSDRIWQYQDLMRQDLGRLLQQGLIQGKGARAIAKDLKKYWFGNDPKTGGGAKYCMERLMRTELARVQTEAQKQSFIRNGFDMYQFICNHHSSRSGTCDICKGLDGKHFKVADMMPGENAPPMHPHCRCSTAAWEDSNEYEAWLDHLENGGTTAEWEKQKEQQKKTSAMRRDPAQFRNRRERKAQGPDFDSMDRNQLISWADSNLKTKLEDTKGASTDFIRDAVKVLNKLEEKMGGNTISGLRVRFGGAPSGTYAQYDPKTKTVHMKKSGNINTFAESQKKENERSLRKLGKRYHATTSFMGTVWHELGHAVDVETGQKLSAALSNSNLDAKSVKISVYAGSSGAVRATKRSEAWAENFAAYMSGENANDVPQEIVEMIEDYFKKKRN